MRYVALGLSLCVLLSACSQDETTEYLTYVEKTIGPQNSGRKVEDYRINRWASDLKICFIAHSEQEIYEEIKLFSMFLNTETTLNISLEKKKDVRKCSKDTYIYFAVNENNERSFKEFFDAIYQPLLHERHLHFPQDTVEVSFYASTHLLFDRKTPFSEASKEQMAFVVFVQLPPKDNQDRFYRRSVVQQELFQALTSARDVDGPFPFPSLAIEYNDEVDENGEEIRSFNEAYYDYNPKNICLSDVMLLKILYSEETAPFNGIYAKYVDYIANNYQKIRSRSEKALTFANQIKILSERC